MNHSYIIIFLRNVAFSAKICTNIDSIQYFKPHTIVIIFFDTFQLTLTLLWTPQNLLFVIKIILSQHEYSIFYNIHRIITYDVTLNGIVEWHIYFKEQNKFKTIYFSLIYIVEILYKIVIVCNTNSPQLFISVLWFTFSFLFE